jgi:iron complex outermembrane recepter protein
MKEKHSIGLAALAVLTSASVMAQDKAADAAKPAASDQPEQIASVVVTGTSTARTGYQTPLSTTALSAKDLARLSSNSLADVLASVPGIKAEGGGGEIGANVQVRGLPSSGQYQFTPLEYDGMPTLSTFGLNSSAYDIFMRPDLGIQRMEFVAGGVSNLFGPGSVAGIINYISKTGTEKHQGTMQVEAAEKGRVRTDLAFSGPLGNGNYYALSGYYRYDEGPLRTGLPTEGMQLRGNLKHNFEDGSLIFYAQMIDDSVQFFAPVPLDGKSLERVTDRYGQEVYTAGTSQVKGLVSILPNGQRYSSGIENGALTRGGSLGVAFERELANGFNLNAKAKYAHYQHQFNFFVEGDGIVNAPETQASFFTNRKVTGATGGTFTYVDSGQPLPADALLYGQRILNRNRPTSDFSGEVNLTKKFEGAGVTHNVTLGSWMGRTKAEDNSLTQTFMAEFASRPRLVNVVASDGTAYTRNGLYDPSVGYSQNTHTSRRYAGYLADQIEAGKWALDAGVRVEHMKGDLSREISSTFNGVSQGGTKESAALTSAIYGTGRYQGGIVETTEWAGSLGALYRLTKNTNVYGNFSHGYFFPELRGVQFNALGKPQSYEGEVIDQQELGVKHSQGGFYGTLALFHSHLKNRRFVTFLNGPDGSVFEDAKTLSTKATGLEGTASYKINRALSVNGNVTYTDHEISEGPYTGNELDRKPKVLANAALTWDDGVFDGNISWNYQSRAFASNANNVVLPAYQLWRLGAGYKIPMRNGQSVHFGLAVYNVANSQGLAEGSPRQDAAQQSGGQYFVGRPILPRRISLTATYNY